MFRGWVGACQVHSSPWHLVETFCALSPDPSSLPLELTCWLIPSLRDRGHWTRVRAHGVCVRRRQIFPGNISRAQMVGLWNQWPSWGSDLWRVCHNIFGCYQSFQKMAGALWSVPLGATQLWRALWLSASITSGENNWNAPLIPWWSRVSRCTLWGFSGGATGIHFLMI